MKKNIYEKTNPVVNRKPEYLKPDEEGFRLLVDSIKDYAIFMIDTTGHITSWNKGAEKIKGYSATEVLGKHISIFYTDEEIQRGEPETNLRITKEEGRFECEGWRVRKDGSLFWADIVFTALYDEEGNLKAFAKVTRDITEQKKSVQEITQLNAELEAHIAERAEELLKSEKKYRYLFEQNPMAVWVVDQSSFKFLDVNEAAIKHYGYSREEFLSMTALDIRPEEEKKRFLELRRSKTSGPYNSGIWKHIKKDGTIIYSEVIAHDIFFEDKKARLVLSNDVTEKVKAEEELSHEKNLLRTLIDNLPDYIYVKDTQSLHLVNNKANIQLMGASNEEETIGKSVIDFFGPQIAKPFIEDDQRIIKTGVAIINREETIVSASGEIKYLLTTKVPIKDKDDKVTGLVGISRDITKQKEVELDLRNSKYFLEKAQKVGQIGHWISDKQTGKLTWSEEVFRIFGIDHSDFDGRIETFLNRIHPDDVEKVKSATAIAVENNQAYSIDHRIILTNGIIKWVHEQGETIYDENGKATMLIGIVQDITERKKIENEILNLNNELEEKVITRTEQLMVANAELEAFSYSVSHDLRAPLRAVSGYSRILKENYESKLDAEGIRLLDRVIGSSKMMGQLIDDLLTFSGMGKKEVTNHSIDMKFLAESCIEELLQNNSVNKWRIHVHSLPSCEGDSGMIKQVWMNLISNALKYSAKTEKPEVEIGFKDDQFMHIYFVRDNGVGFEMEYAHKLFGVFQRLHSHEEFEGTGVGLALVKRIINKHNGDIWAEATPGKGATFYFSLPAVQTGLPRNENQHK